MKETNDEHIALRSEKIRHLLSEIPSTPLRAGVAVMAFILIAIIIAMVFLPYPYSDGESILKHLTHSF